MIEVAALGPLLERASAETRDRVRKKA